MAISLVPTPLTLLTDQLSASERDRLCARQPIVTGQSGHYVGWVLTSASPETVWAVLTDYANFSQLLPSVVDSQVLKAEGSRKVVEQLDVRRVLFTEVKSRVCTENIENPPDRIDFRLIDGDLDRLEGNWKIYLAEPADSAKRQVPQVLITQTVDVEASVGLFEGLFHPIFQSSLKENLAAIQHEAERRM